MIDSGASQCFINLSLVRKLGIPLVPLREPIALDVADGRPIESGAITHKTLPASMIVGRHHEKIHFFVTNIGHHSIILGTPWLKKHNPSIHWPNSTIDFNSDFCKTKCITRPQHSNTNIQQHQSTVTSINSNRQPLCPDETSQPKLGRTRTFESSLETPEQKPGRTHIRPALDETSEQKQECTRIPSVFDEASQQKLECTLIPEVLEEASMRKQESTRSAQIPKPSSKLAIGSIGLRSLNYLIKTRQVESIIALDLNESGLKLPPSPDLSLNGKKVSVSTLDPAPDTFDNTIPVEFQDYSDVFSKISADKLPEHGQYDHTIPLESGTKPPFGRIYGLSEVELKALDEYLKDNLAKGFIRPSSSPAGAPILFVKKSDGSLRLCVDYRGLNKITIKNRYPLPLIQENLDRLKHAKYFTKIDLRGAYNLIRIAAGEEWKTAFRTRYGLFEYLVMPFGLTNAPASFQQLMNEVLREYLDNSVIVYLDDILIFSNTREEHVNHVKSVLSKLRHNRLWAKAEKCKFFQTSVDFLGYIVSTDGISMDPSKVKSILDWPAPKSVKDIQVFLGFANFYRRFIKNYSKITAPLTKLLRKNTKFQWNDPAQNAFDSLKKSFTSAPILTHFDPGRPIILETDASDFALAGIISHPAGPGRLQPIAFYSRKFNDAELNYEIYDKELLAIIACLKEWRAYCEGSRQKVTIYSDHKNLEYFNTSKVLTRRQARWMEFLSHIDFEIIYRKGVLMAKPDALTRRSDLQGGSKASEAAPKALLKPGQFRTSTDTFDSPPSSFNLAPLQEGSNPPALPYSDLSSRILAFQAEDPLLSEITPLLRDVDTPYNREQLELTKGYYLSPEDLVYFNNKVYVPDNHQIKLDILRQTHDSPLAGHLGQAKTFALVSRHYFWPGMRAFVNTYVQGCQTCQRNKTPRHKPVGLLQPLPIPSGPWQSISMDAIVKLPLSDDYDCIMVIVDRLTKMAHFLPFKEEGFTSEHLAKMMRFIFRLHGIPQDIVSDRGPIFTSKFWRAFASGLKIKLNFSTAYHPQTDGQTERLNQVLEQYIRMYTNYNQDNWVDLLDKAEFTYNNSEHASTKMTPFYANFGYHPLDPSALVEPLLNPLAKTHLEELSDIRQRLIANIEKAQADYAKYYDRKVKTHLNLEDEPLYNVGDKVWLNAKDYPTSRPSAKLDHKLLGPFKIIERISDLVYRLDLPPTMEINNSFHISRLEPFKEGHANQPQQEMPRIVIQGEREYIPERILDGGYEESTNRFVYLVHWEGYPDSEDTWEPYEELKHLKIFKKFQSDRKDSPEMFPPPTRHKKSKKRPVRSQAQGTSP
jgi:hypothetical protein